MRLFADMFDYWEMLKIVDALYLFIFACLLKY